MHPSIVHGLEAVAGRLPNHPALTWHAARWTYRDLASGARLVAHALAERDLPRGSRIALLFKNSPHYIAWYYGVLAAGHVVVPLNPQERAGVLGRQIAHSGAMAVAGDPGHPEWAALGSELDRSPREIARISVDLDTTADSASAFIRRARDPIEREPARSAWNLPPCAADDLAAIIYTSGTTGQPKGVMLSHANLAASAASIVDYLGLTSTDRALCVLPFQFAYGNSVLHTHLLSGSELVIEDNSAFPQRILQRLQDDAITAFYGVPSTFALLLGRGRPQSFGLSRLRLVAQAGGAMPRAAIERLRRQIPAAQVFIMYGQTEATSRISYLPPERLGDKLGSVGIEVPGVQIEVRRGGTPASPGEIGEICVRGRNVMLGYWNDPVASAQVLRGGWLHTGDLGYRDADGFLFIHSRAVEMIKVGAFRVSPKEIEEVIAALEGVEEVAVAGVADSILGQVVKAVIVRRPGATLDALAVKARCHRELAAYKVPKVVEFAANLPRTTSGKIQRLKLA